MLPNSSCLLVLMLTAFTHDVIFLSSTIALRSFGFQASRHRPIMFASSSDAASSVGRGTLGDRSKAQPESEAGTEGPGSYSDWQQRISLSIAKSRKIKGGNYVQIATVDEAGFPNCRTVVFRGFLKPEDRPLQPHGTLMKMITDARSEKVAQILSNDNCELVWWFSESSEQYRIRGKLLLCGAVGEFAKEPFLHSRLETWKSLSDPAREQFYWPAPGPHDGTLPPVPSGGRNQVNGTILPPPENFLLLLLAPTQVKYLRLTDNLALLDSLIPSALAVDPVDGYDGRESWEVKRINP